MLGEFTLADFKQLEMQALQILQSSGTVNLLLDMRDMIGYTVDVAWEEIKFFGREHPQDFARIAVITNDQWLTWQTWLSRLFVDADIRAYNDYEEARTWITSE